MCMPKPSVPKQEVAPPPPKVEEQKTDNDIIARQRIRRNSTGSVNTRSTMLGGGDSPTGKKTLLGQ